MRYLSITLFLFVLNACQSQPNRQTSEDLQVGGRCEGCEAWSEYGDRSLNPVDTIEGFEHYSPKLKITGKEYDQNKQPASGIIVYFYHTDREGIYAKPKNAQGWGSRHGKHRAWVKTDQSGEYTIYTFRPARYPNSNAMEHIHITVKEPGKTAYYIDDILFTDDEALTETHKARLSKRGGSGLVTPKRKTRCSS